MTDLFGDLPPPAPPQRRVASFQCMCGCRDEVREPCPDLIPCWDAACQKAGRMMTRWHPGYDPPWTSARDWIGD